MNQKRNNIGFRRIVSAVIILLAAHSLFGQFVFLPTNVDSNYVVDYREKITTRLYSLRESIVFSIDPQELGPEIRYRPNIHSRTGLAAFYKWFGIGLAIATPLFASENEKEKGRSYVLDLRLNAYSDAIVGEVVYQKFRSFYISNPSSVMDSWKHGMVYPQRKDMSVHSFSTIFYYVLNYKKHSLKAAYLQNMRQKKSSGSLIFGPAFNFLRVDADSGLVPSNFTKKHNLDDELNIEKGQFTTLGIYAGYSYTLVFLKNFYINASLLPGIYFKHSNYDSPSHHYSNGKWSLLWITRAALGYNSDKWYCGLGGVTGFLSEPLPVGNANFNMDLLQIRLWIGTRFNIFAKKKKNE